MVSSEQSSQGWSLYLACCPDEWQWEDTLPTTMWDLGWGLGFPFKGTAWCPGHAKNWVSSSSLNLDHTFCCMKTVLRNQSVGVNCEYWHSWAFKGHKCNMYCRTCYRDMEAFLVTWGTLWMFKCTKLAVCHSPGMKCSPCTIGITWSLSPEMEEGKFQSTFCRRVGGCFFSESASGTFLSCISLPRTGTKSWPQTWLSTREETWAICCSGPGCPCIPLGQCQEDLWGSSCGTAAAGWVLLLL